jgi:DNA-binding response OmpR family regulator
LSQRLRILVVEDHRDLAANLGDFLGGRGHAVELAHDGVTGMHLAVTRELDVIVLDVMLPGIDGLAFCRKLRTEARRTTPVLMLTARDTLDDKIAGFDAGTDDYLTKPFSMEELHARLHALVRRTRPQPEEVLRVRDLELDLGTRTVHRAGVAIELPPALVTILAELMHASPKVVTRRRLETILWGDEVRGGEALRSQIYLLRQAIDRPFAAPLVQTVHGVGYRIYGGDGR